MDTPQRPVHLLRGNAREQTPRRVMVLDTETRQQQREGRELHTLRCWASVLLDRDQRRRRPAPQQWEQGETAEQLAETVAAAARSSATTWVFAHNLGFDLTVTRLPVLLLEAGWSLGRHALTADSPWLQLRQGGRRLTLADSFSWLPYSLERIAQQMGLSKLRLPETDDSPEAWLARCRTDVQITATALLDLMDWWDRERLGYWSLTGPASGWNVYRHRKGRLSVTIDPDPEARAWERGALCAGRREVWRVGRLPRARYLEIDLERAHLTVARFLALPRRRSFPAPLDLAELERVTTPHWAPLAEVTVSTETPRYPVRLKGQLFYPVGTFRTTLAGPEIAEARRRGELRAIHRGRMYLLGETMAEWGHWLARLLDGDIADTPAAAQLAAKAWSRRVPGKWATRTSRTADERESPEPVWSLERGYAHPEGVPCVWLHLRGRRYLLLQDQESDDSFPAVLAWIQSYVRLALSRLIDHFGPERVIACNTDGLIVQAHRTPDPEQLAALCPPFRPRLKAVYKHVEVISPQHLILDGGRRLSGVPASASPAGELRYAWVTWPRFARQLELGAREGYSREPRHATLAQVPVNRWILSDGRTMPVRCQQDGPGDPEALRPDLDPFWPESALLAPAQHPLLTNKAWSPDPAGSPRDRDQRSA